MSDISMGAGTRNGDAVVVDNTTMAKERRARFVRGTRNRVLSMIVLLVVWQLVSMVMKSSVLPSPIDVVVQLGKNLGEGNTYYQLYITIVRVLLGMALGVTSGIIAGIIMGLSRLGEELLDVWVLSLFTVPAIVYAMLCLLWFGLNDWAAIIAVGVGVLPAIAINMWQGTKAIDRDLIHMARSFRFSRRSIVLRVVLPQLIPYILAAFRYGLGLSWKIVTVVELLGLSSGVGYTLNYWFGNFSMVQVMAWTLLFTITLLIIEYGILKPVEAYLTRWRPVSQAQGGV
ncbi:ABC transporter permease [Microbacterium kribbense]|uniref:ABC transporter permease n=2 Tax=Microbacterium kribbense TaxID=433645 RepID=A0ABP7GRY6_9MICO